MTAKYFAILTNYGAAQLANAVALGTQMNISAMAVGDGGGTLPVPDPAQTKLVRETRRAAVNQVSIDEKNPNFIIAEQVIPENEGGWFIREIGLFDDNGGLIAVGNAPETYKPNLQEGSGRTQVIQMVLMVSSTQAITLKVDPSVVLATREYVTRSIDAAIQASEARAAKTYQPIGDYVLNPFFKLEMLKKIDKADISQQLGNDPNKVGSQLLLTEQLGKKASTTDVNGKMAKDKNGADIQDKEAFIKNLGLPEKYQPKGNYQPAGDYPLASSVFGIGQKWYGMTTQRKLETVYKNNTGKGIYIAVCLASDGIAGLVSMKMYVDDVPVGTNQVQVLGEKGRYTYATVATFVPAGSSYYLTVPAAESQLNINSWSEMR